MVSCYSHGQIIQSPVRNHKDILQQVEKLLPILNNFTWIVSAGTALGLYRDKELIPHDTDFDIEIFDIAQENVNILNHMLCKTLKPCRTMLDDYGRVSQLAYYLPNKFIFDIYFYYKEDHEFVNYNDVGVLRLPKYYVFNRQLINGLYFPQPIESYLEFRYGKDWETPSKKKQDWSKDAGDALLKQ